MGRNKRKSSSRGLDQLRRFAVFIPPYSHLSLLNHTLHTIRTGFCGISFLLRFVRTQGGFLALAGEVVGLVCASSSHVDATGFKNHVIN